MWREAFGLGVLDALLPDVAPDERIVVNRTLLTGKASVHRGGSRLKASTIERLSRREREIVSLVERVRVDWTESMNGVDVHAFRKTHQTWTEAQGVPAVLIDEHLGHALPGGAQLDAFRAVRAMSGSAVGRKHYLDLGSKLLDPTPSAEAVRGLIDQALEVRSAERTLATAGASG